MNAKVPAGVAANPADDFRRNMTLMHVKDWLLAMSTSLDYFCGTCPQLQT